MIRLFCVRVSAFGCDRPTMLYFKKKADAKAFSDSHDFADNPVTVTFDDDKAYDCLLHTDAYFHPDKYFF